MDYAALLEERRSRVAKAVRLEETDRTPVVMEYCAFAARVTNTPMVDFVNDITLQSKAMLDAFEIIGDADGIDYECMDPRSLSLTWLSKTKLPGDGLPDDAMWQVGEAELMTTDDYDRIVEEGWPNWQSKFVAEKISPEILPRMAANALKAGSILDMWREKGVPVMRGPASSTIPFEILCGGRSMAKFTRDLYKMPDKVQAAIDAMMPYMTLKAVAAAQQFGLDYCWLGGWRSASAMLAPKLWDRFVFPYFQKMIDIYVEANIVPILHFDSDWERDLARFREFPKGKCILELDGMTNIFKAKEIVGDHLCIMGDVPAAMLSLGTPDEVHTYCRKLIDGLGPTGFILHPGCDIPIDAKLENVQAIVAAATGK